MINKLSFSGVCLITPPHGTDLEVRRINIRKEYSDSDNPYKSATECQVGDVITKNPNNPSEDRLLVQDKTPDGHVRYIKLSGSKLLKKEDLEDMKVGHKLNIVLGTTDEWDKI